MSEGIVIKAKSLVSPSFRSGIAKISNFGKYPSFTTAVKIGQLTRSLEDISITAQKTLENSVKDLRGDDDKIKPEMQDEFDKKRAEFMETDLTIDIKRFDVNNFEHVGLTPSEIVMLEPIFDPSSFPQVDA